MVITEGDLLHWKPPLEVGISLTWTKDGGLREEFLLMVWSYGPPLVSRLLFVPTKWESNTWRQACKCQLTIDSLEQLPNISPARDYGGSISPVFSIIQ